MEKSQYERWAEQTPMIPSVPIANCPIATSLGVLGRKWTLLILRDIGMRKQERFSELLDSVGLTRRVLSMRLRELEREEIIERVEDRKRPRVVRWNLTEKGWDSLPILMSYVAFGSKWHAKQVFPDRVPKEIKQVYPQKELRNSYVNLELE